MAHAREGAIRCPRCGYDQRGVVATWREACPLEGVCAECGVPIRWAEVLLPEKFEPLWCVEFVPRWRRFPIACWSTFRRSLWPWSFWRRMRMAFPVRPVRLIIYGLLILIAPLLALHVPVQTFLAIRARQLTVQQINSAVSPLSSKLQFFQSQLALLQSNDPSFQPVDREGTMRDLQVRINALQAATLSKPHIEGPLWLAIVEAIIRPNASTSWCSIMMGSQLYEYYIPPAKLRLRLFRSLNSINPFADTQFKAGLALIACWGLWLAFPPSLVLLPVSRRRAKVLWRHIFRITIYSLVLVSLVQLLIFLAWNLLWFTRNAVLLWCLDNLVLALLFALPAYWSIAIKHHLKMPHAKTIAVLITVLIALLLFTVLAEVLPRPLVRVILGRA